MVLLLQSLRRDCPRLAAAALAAPPERLRTERGRQQVRCCC